MNITEKLVLKVQVHDAKGKLINEFEKLSESFLHQWNLHHYLMFNAAASPLNINDTGGAARAVSAPVFWAAGNIWVSLLATANDETMGIAVGRGGAAVTLADFSLQTRCAEGVGANQFTHGASTVTNTPGVPMDYIEARRVLTNGSGNTINVTECGLQCNSFSSAFIYQYLLIRDVFVAVPVADTQTLTVTYQIQILL